MPLIYYISQGKKRENYAKWAQAIWIFCQSLEIRRNLRQKTVGEKWQEHSLEVIDPFTVWSLPVTEIQFYSVPTVDCRSETL